MATSGVSFEPKAIASEGQTKSPLKIDLPADTASNISPKKFPTVTQCDIKYFEVPHPLSFRVSNTSRNKVIKLNEGSQQNSRVFNDNFYKES